MANGTVEGDHLETRQIKDVASARSIYARLKRNDEKRAKARATLRTQLEGGKPYNQQVLRKRAESWRCNENFRDAESDRDTALSPYYDMANNTRRHIAVAIHDDESKSDRWQSIYEENFDKFLRDWKGYTANFLKVAHELIDFGTGYPYFKDEFTPRYESMPTGRILFPDDTPIDIDRWDMLCIEKKMTAPELFKYIKGKNSSRASIVGWRPKAVKALIKQQAHFAQKPERIFEWEELQTELISNDIFLSQDMPVAEVVILLVAQNDIEKDGIGCWIFPANAIETKHPGGNGRNIDGNPDDGFLFTRPKNYASSFERVLPAIFYEVGQGNIHSVKGFALRNFALSALTNRQKCKLIDAAMFSMSMNFKRSADKGSDAPPITSHGAVNIIPSDLDIIDFTPKTSEAIAVAEYISRGASQNNINFTDQSKQIAQTETAAQAKLLAASAQRVNSVSAALFLDQLGEVYAEQFRRLRSGKGGDPDARKFKKRCIDMGIPKKVFHTLEVTITAGNATGGANPVLRAIQSRETFSLLRAESRVNKDWLLENIIADTHGSRAVDKALLPTGQVSDEWDSRQAIMENDHMNNAVEMPVTEVDGHMAHLGVHVGTMEASVEGFNQSGQMQEPTMKMLQLLIPHTNEHFELIQDDDSVAQQRNILFGKFSNLQREIIGIFNSIASQATAQAKRDQDEFTAQNRNRLPSVSTAAESPPQQS